MEQAKIALFDSRRTTHCSGWIQPSYFVLGLLAAAEWERYAEYIQQGADTDTVLDLIDAPDQHLAVFH
jgi:hypothetical protein